MTKAESMHKKRLLDLRLKEKQLKEEVERERKALNVMEDLARERHANVELHEKKVIEIKGSYENKLKHVEKKEKELIESENKIKAQHSELSKKLHDIGRIIKLQEKEKLRIDEKVSQSELKKRKLESELAEMQKRDEKAVQQEKELKKELERKASQMMHHQKQFEHLLNAGRLLEEQNKAAGDKLQKTVESIGEREQHLKSLEKKVKQLSYLDKKFSNELEKHALNDIFDFMRQIEKYLAKKDFESAANSYNIIRRLYHELGHDGKEKVYVHIMKIKDKLRKHLSTATAHAKF